MSNPWDLTELRKIAGLQEAFETKQSLLERYDDDDNDDEEDIDVKHAEDEAKKRKIKLPEPEEKIDPDKDIHKLAQARKAFKGKKEIRAEEEAKKAKESSHEEKESPAKEKAEHGGKTPSKEAEKKETPAAEKKEEAKAAEKKETPAEEKKEETAAEKKARGRVPNAGSKRQRLHAHMKANPGEKRSVLLKWAQDNLEMGAAYASQQIQVVKSQIKNECFILRHPTIPSFVLHENLAMNMYQWISETDENLEPMVFATETEAKQTASYLLSYKNQLCEIERIELED